MKKTFTVEIVQLCAFGSDGASCSDDWSIKGVAVRLKSHSQSMIAVHCVNHRLALAAAHASESTCTCILLL